MPFVLIPQNRAARGGQQQMHMLRHMGCLQRPTFHRRCDLKQVAYAIYDVHFVQAIMSNIVALPTRSLQRNKSTADASGSLLGMSAEDSHKSSVKSPLPTQGVNCTRCRNEKLPFARNRLERSRTPSRPPQGGIPSQIVTGKLAAKQK